MLRRKKIKRACPADMQYYDDMWDPALLGFAESGAPGRSVLPAYGYQAMKSILKDQHKTPAEIYKVISKLRNIELRENPIILMKIERKELWQTIVAKKYSRWDQLDRAIIGLGYRGWDRIGIVYSKPLCLATLVANQTSSSKNHMLEVSQAANLLEESIIPVMLGSYSPWFLTPIN